MNASMCHNLKNKVMSRDIRVVIIRRIVYTLNQNGQMKYFFFELTCELDFFVQYCPKKVRQLKR
jgi:hypothetical protein